MGRQYQCAKPCNTFAELCNLYTLRANNTYVSATAQYPCPRGHALRKSGSSPQTKGRSFLKDVRQLREAGSPEKHARKLAYAEQRRARASISPYDTGPSHSCQIWGHNLQVRHEISLMATSVSASVRSVCWHTSSDKILVGSAGRTRVA